MLMPPTSFMTFAWFGHLKFKGVALPLVTWRVGIALFEYCLAVPANRLGARSIPPQLKTSQEVITLVVFAGFSAVYLKDRSLEPRVGFALIAGGAFFIFHEW